MMVIIIVPLGTSRYKRRCGSAVKKLEAIGLRDVPCEYTARLGDRVIRLGEQLRVVNGELEIPHVELPWWNDGENWDRAADAVEEFLGRSRESATVFSGHSHKTCD